MSNKDWRFGGYGSSADYIDLRFHDAGGTAIPTHTFFGNGDYTTGGNITVGSGVTKRQFYACGSPIQGNLVMASDVTAAIQNCQRINATCASVTALSIFVRY
ncbi:hypothetical protein JW935_07160 [candidate division KSB1 bacterium]|nr:hypothetical protein [candidate division KSB1 bacterium]